jgi:hypothetical protein
MKNLQIYGTSLSYGLDDKIIVLEALKPYRPSTRKWGSFYDILQDIVRVEKLNLSDCRVLYKNRLGNWSQLVMGKYKTSFKNTKETDYQLAKQKIKG